MLHRRTVQHLKASHRWGMLCHKVLRYCIEGLQRTALLNHMGLLVHTGLHYWTVHQQEQRRCYLVLHCIQVRLRNAARCYKFQLHRLVVLSQLEVLHTLLVDLRTWHWLNLRTVDCHMAELCWDQNHKVALHMDQELSNSSLMLWQEVPALRWRRKGPVLKCTGAPDRTAGVRTAAHCRALPCWVCQRDTSDQGFLPKAHRGCC